MPLPGRGRSNSGRTPGSGGPPFKQRRIITRQDSSGMDPTTVKYIVFFLIFVMGILGHSVAAMVLVHADPAAAARVMPGAEEYLRKQLLWIRTGWDPEYELGVWLPAHLGQLGGGILYSYVSLGWITLFEGFRE